MCIVKSYLITFSLISFSLTGFAQKKANNTTRTYARKEGKFRYLQTGNYVAMTSFGSSVNDYALFSSADFVVPESDFKVEPVSIIDSALSSDCQFKLLPTSLIADTSGITLYVGVLRYKNAVIDICPLPKNVLTYEYESSFAALHFKILKSRVSGEDEFELTTKYKFQLRDGYLLKQVYLGSGKIDLPEYLNLKIEAVTLK
jgi:hypothetical protein